MIQFKEKDLEVKKDRLPNKEERKEIKKLEEEAQKNKTVLRDLCLEFFNEKLAVLDIPFYQVEEHVPVLIRTLFSMNKSMSKEFEVFLEAKKNLEETNISELKRNEKL